jgi:hypothetical protein
MELTAKKKQESNMIEVETIGHIPLERALKILRSLGKYFGGRTTMDQKARSDRAKKAANTRWQNQDQ